MRIGKLIGAAVVIVGAACGNNSIYGGGGGGAPCDGQGADVVVSATSILTFSPESILITAGKKVCWQNVASFDHTVTSDTGTVLGSTIGAGGHYTHTFASTGTVTYHCAIHQAQGMVGKVVIQ
ncbi:MAG TPA: plastocyanin/azurin family copper-binding protein [Gemmatimonadales bacterium]